VDTAGHRTDLVVRIDTVTGKLTNVHTTKRNDVVAIVAPPPSAGPWGGFVFFLWTRKSGLVGIKSRNEGIQEVHIGLDEWASSVDCLCFGSDGMLYGLGAQLHAFDAKLGAHVTTLNLPSPMASATWEPEDPIMAHFRTRSNHGGGVPSVSLSDIPDSPVDGRPGGLAIDAGLAETQLDPVKMRQAAADAIGNIGMVGEQLP
jgi:hypothetical protein